jgi:carbamoyl-phosphate synthase large subunit
MPKRTDIHKVLVIGSGPIVIGQASEFDYSGTQAIKALREEGVQVVLPQQQPATVMTDPEFAHRTYIEPITVEAAEQIIERERPTRSCPTMGGQTALNLAKALAEKGILERYGVKLIGASLQAINKAEDRQLFKAAMQKIGVPLPRSGYATSLDEAKAVVKDIGFPAIIRPSFTLGGTGGGVAYNSDEFESICLAGLKASPTSTLLVEESVLGWKEFELEVVRDTADNVIIICSIENLRPDGGPHRGQHHRRARPQTLTDKEYQRPPAGLAGHHPGDRRRHRRVQHPVRHQPGGRPDGRHRDEPPGQPLQRAGLRRPPGTPSRRIAAKLAMGYRLDELKNDNHPGDTPASFSRRLTYVVVKIPRFNFEKFPPDRLAAHHLHAERGRGDGHRHGPFREAT